MNTVLMNAGLLTGSTAPGPERIWRRRRPGGRRCLAAKEAGDEDAGVDVKSVVPGSAADKAGLKRGDRLLTLDGRWTDSIEDLYEAAGFVKAGTKVVVRIKRGGKEMDLEVTPVSGM